MQPSHWPHVTESPGISCIPLMLETSLIAAIVKKVLLVVAPVLQDGRVGPARPVARVGETVHVGYAGVVGGVVEPVH